MTRSREVAMQTVFELALKERLFMNERIKPCRDFFDRVFVPRLFRIIRRTDPWGWPTRGETVEEC